MAQVDTMITDALQSNITHTPIWFTPPQKFVQKRVKSGQNTQNNNNYVQKYIKTQKSPGVIKKAEQNCFALLSECLAQDIVARRVFGDEEWPLRRRVTVRAVCKQWKNWVDEKVSAIKPGELSDSFILKLSKSLSHVSHLDLTNLREHQLILPTQQRQRHQFHQHNSQLSKIEKAQKIDGEILGLLSFLPQLSYISLSMHTLASAHDLVNLRLLSSRQLSLKIQGVDSGNYQKVLVALTHLRFLEDLELVGCFGQKSCIAFLLEVNVCFDCVALDLTLTDVMYDEYTSDYDNYIRLVNLLCRSNYIRKLTDATHGSWLRLHSAVAVVAANSNIQKLILGKNWLGVTPLHEIEELDQSLLDSLSRVPQLEMGTQIIDFQQVSQMLQQRLQLNNIVKLTSGGNIKNIVTSQNQIQNLQSLSLLADGTFVSQISYFDKLINLTRLTCLDIRLHFWGFLEDDRKCAIFVAKLIKTISQISSLQELTITKMRFDKVQNAESKVLVPLTKLNKLKKLEILDFSGVLRGEKFGSAVVGRIFSLVELKLLGGKRSSGNPGGVVMVEGQINNLLSARRSKSLRDSRIQQLTVWPLLNNVDCLISLAHLAHIAHLKVGFVGRGIYLQPRKEVLEYVRSSLAGLRNLHIEFLSDIVF